MFKLKSAFIKKHISYVGLYAVN